MEPEKTRRESSGIGWVVRALPIAGGIYALVAGTISLMGWILDAPLLADWDGDGISIKANPSICIILAAIGLLAWIVTPSKRWIPITAGAITATIAGLTLSQHLTGVDLGIDTLLFHEATGARATSAPGRMGLPASLSLTGIGVALVLVSSKRWNIWTSVFGTLALAVSALSLIGYGFGADQLFTFPRLTGIAWQTATMLAALGIGLIAAVPERGVGEVLGRDDAGGAVFRRLFIPLVAITLITSFGRVAGQGYGLFDPAFGVALGTIIQIALLLGLLWMTANSITRSEGQIREGTVALAERDERIRGVLESLSDAFISFDADLRLAQINSAVRTLFSNSGVEPLGTIGKHVFEVFPEARETTLGKGLVRCHTEKVAIEMEEFYEPFSKWFHARFFPTSDGGVSIFALDITERKDAELLVARRAHELAVLYGFSDRLNRADSLGEVYEAALDTIVKAIGCQRASILLFDDQGVMSFVASRGLSDEYKAAVNGHSPWKQGEKDAQPIGIEDIREAEIDPDLQKLIVDEGIFALGFIPLISNDTLIGKFMVYYDETHHFTEAEFELSLTVGYQIAFGVERKRTEEALRENEQRLRVATQTGKVGVWDWDIKANHIEWTPTVYTMHGVEPGGFDGKVDSFTNLIHPEDREAVGERIGLALSEDVPYEVEFRVPKTDGGINWLFTNAVVLRDETGKPIRMIGATVDITEPKNAERELARVAAIVESSRDAIVGNDLNGVITSWNKGAARLFGYTADEIIGKSVTTLIPQDRLDEETPILERLNRGDYIDHYETIRRHKDGTLLEISLTVSPVFDSRGKIIGASKIARDITERRQAEAALRDREVMKRLVEAQEAERHRIARDLHDHLGQQLTALRLKLESIRSKCNENEVLAREMEETQEYAARIDMDINYLAWELRPTELDQLGLRDALQSFVREWSNTYGITAEFHASENYIDRLSPELETNLYRIVQEGLNNILKHAHASNVNVLLEMRGSRIVLIIEDDGNGFDPESDRRSAGGKGLGLVGMRERTALLGGTLEIESRPGEGTTVFARVPAVISEGNGNGQL